MSIIWAEKGEEMSAYVWAPSRHAREVPQSVEEH